MTEGCRDARLVSAGHCGGWWAWHPGRQKARPKSAAKDSEAGVACLSGLNRVQVFRDEMSSVEYEEARTMPGKGRLPTFKYLGYLRLAATTCSTFQAVKQN